MEYPCLELHLGNERFLDLLCGGYCCSVLPRVAVERSSVQRFELMSKVTLLPHGGERASTPPAPKKPAFPVSVVV